tara:strand:- start:1123 stop:3081 length:1959 start_codon:yes stop_codon:yes gene_type:complete
MATVTLPLAQTHSTVSAGLQDLTETVTVNITVPSTYNGSSYTGDGVGVTQNATNCNISDTTPNCPGTAAFTVTRASGVGAWSVKVVYEDFKQGSTVYSFSRTLSGYWADATPNNYSWPATHGAPLNTYIYNNVQLSGFNTTLSVTCSGLATSVSNSTTAGTFSTAAKNITTGQYLHTRILSSGSFGTTVSGTTSVGGLTRTKSVTTLVADTTPNSWSATDQVNQELNIQHYYIRQITGINTSVNVTASGTAGTLFKVNNSSSYVATGYSTPGTTLSITNGQYLHVAILAAPTYSTNRNITVSIGGVSDNWSVTTRAADVTPNAFNLPDQTNAARSTFFYSVAYISGIEAAVSFNGSGSGAVAVSNTAGNGSGSTSSGLAYTTGAVNVSNGQYLHVRLASSASFSTTTSTTVTGGGVSSVFSITTLAADTTPNAFSFTNVTNAALNSPYTRSAQITGLNASTLASVSGNSAKIAVTSSSTIPSDAAFTTASISMSNTNYIHVKMNASGSYSTAVSTTVNVGGVTSAWSVTTGAQGGTGGGGGTGTGAGTSSNLDYGIQLIGTDGSTEVLGVNTRTSNLQVYQSVFIAANSTSSVIACPDANNSSKILITVAHSGGFGNNNFFLSVSNKTSTGFTVTNTASSGLTVKIVAIRIT